MATLTTRILAGYSPGSGPATTASFTPASSSLLCVIAAADEQTGVGMTAADLTISDSTGATWTSRALTGAAPSWYYGLRAWTTPITTGASMTVSIDCGAVDLHDVAIWAFDVTGYDTGSPIGGTAVGSDADGNGAASLTLSAAPASGDIVAAAVMVQTAGTGAVTHGTGWTEAGEVSSPEWTHTQFQHITGVTSTSVDWVDLSTSGTPLDALMLALVIKAAGGGGTQPPRSMNQYRLRRA